MKVAQITGALAYGVDADWSCEHELKIVGTDREDLLDDMDEGSAQEAPAGFLHEIVNVDQIEDASSDEHHKADAAKAVVLRARAGGVDVGDGFVSYCVEYVRMHGIPGRRYAKGGSVQKMARVKRHVALKTKRDSTYCFVDVDIVHCFAVLLWNLLASCVGEFDLSEFQTFRAFKEHPAAWRAFLMEYFGTDMKTSKKALVRILHLGKPLSDVPFLWALAHEVSMAVSIVLALPRFRHLHDMFKDRRSPTTTRLHFALASLEDEIIQDLEARVGVATAGVLGEHADGEPLASVVTLMFDGAILRVRRSELPGVRRVLDDLGDRWSVEFTMKIFEDGE
jgi:hypothetical protein